MLTKWQEPLFRWVENRLPFLRSQPLSTFSMACILGDGTYVLNGKVGSLFDLGLGSIHPGLILTLGGVAALIGHVFLLASADQVDGAHEQGWVSRILSFCRAGARNLLFGWRPAQPFMIGFAALTLNGVALTLDAVWEMLFFGLSPVVLIQFANGVIVVGGLGAAMLSRRVQDQQWRDRLNRFAPQLLAYATCITIVLGLLAVAPFMLLGGLLFVVGNAAQSAYAHRVSAQEREQAAAPRIA